VPGMMTSEFQPLLINFAVGLTLVGWVAVLVACFLWDRGSTGPGPVPGPLPVDHPTAVAPGPPGEPDLTPPSTSEEALEEVARLEALWALPAHEANSRRD
jgi:hypothetical protein